MHVLSYGRSGFVAHGYTNTGYIGDLDECKSTSANTLLRGGAISWCSKKFVVALSIMKVDYVIASAMQEPIWLKRFLRDFEVVPHASDPVTLHCDSMVVISHAKIARYHTKTKCIYVKFYFIKNSLEESHT